MSTSTAAGNPKDCGHPLEIVAVNGRDQTIATRCTNHACWRRHTWRRGAGMALEVGRVTPESLRLYRPCLRPVSIPDAATTAAA